MRSLKCHKCWAARKREGKNLASEAKHGCVSLHTLAVLLQYKHPFDSVSETQPCKFTHPDRVAKTLLPSSGILLLVKHSCVSLHTQCVLLKMHPIATKLHVNRPPHLHNAIQTCYNAQTLKDLLKATKQTKRSKTQGKTCKSN